MLSVAGVPVFTDPTMVRRVEKRVRGGYLNRWLIRAVVDEPLSEFRCVHNPRNGLLVSVTCHPAMLSELKRVEPKPQPWERGFWQ